MNLTRRLHQCRPELFWAEDPMQFGLSFIAFLSDPEGSCTPFRPSLPLCFPIRHVCFGCFGCRFKAFQASGSVDFACLSILHCHGVFLSGKCGLAAVWAVIRSFSAGSRRDVTVFSHLGDAFLGCSFWGVNIWPRFGAPLPARENIL